METKGVTYIRIGRGDDSVALEIDPKIRSIIIRALRDLTVTGEMATAGLPQRTPEGTRQANLIFKIAEALEKKKD